MGGPGHPIHRPAAPRRARLFAIAADNGLSGRHIELMNLISDEATRAYRRDLPVNATGAIGAILGELDFPWQVGRGLAVIARALGLLPHIREELAEPLAGGDWGAGGEGRAGDTPPHQHRRPLPPPT